MTLTGWQFFQAQTRIGSPLFGLTIFIKELATHNPCFSPPNPSFLTKNEIFTIFVPKGTKLEMLFVAR